MKFRIYRYNPETDTAPYMQDYDLDLQAGDAMLLDALMLLRQQDDSLGFRKSCREGVCGSDAMNINGRNGLACITALSSLKQPIELRPLPGLPVIRDLIVDMTQFFKQYHSIKPYLINNDPPPETERLQSPKDRAELDGLYECILCGCAPPPVPRSGGTRTSSSVPPACCRPTASSLTRATRPPPSAWMIWKTPTVCSVAIAS